jgi:hypothetical protein
MMSPNLTLSLAKPVTVLAAAACAASVLWVVRQEPGIAAVRAEPLQPAFPAAAVEPATPALPAAREARWPDPPAQSSGSGWVYEVFTPPVIFYNAGARSFAVTPPHYANDATESVFGLELLSVKREPFRLQLVGYFGGPGDYLAAFESTQTPETLLAREGRRFEALGLTLRSFDVRKVVVESEAPGPVYDVAALAVLQDDRTGAMITLDNRSRLLTDTPIAVFQVPGARGRPRELHEGDSFADQDATYRVERIQLDPPEVVVARTAPGVPVPEVRVLRPAAVAAKGRPAGPHPEPPDRGVAVSGK